MENKTMYHFVSLPNTKMWAALREPPDTRVAIYGCVDFYDKIISLCITNMDSPLDIPFSAFEPSGTGLAPDFTQFSIIDYGQTVKLGEYEAAVECLIAEFGGKSE